MGDRRESSALRRRSAHCYLLFSMRTSRRRSPSPPLRYLFCLQRSAVRRWLLARSLLTHSSSSSRHIRRNGRHRSTQGTQRGQICTCTERGRQREAGRRSTGCGAMRIQRACDWTESAGSDLRSVTACGIWNHLSHCCCDSARSVLLPLRLCFCFCRCSFVRSFVVRFSLAA